jgi:6-pyruvoyltetrahydropterin/6-carboxytetrahydropterin synthase
VAPHSITKAIEFCYGHRLLGHDGKCRYLHGHNGRLEVEVQDDSLDDQGMVMDFADLRDTIAGWIDANIDHRMVLWEGDPAATVLGELGQPVYLLDESPTAENLSKHIFMRAGELGLKVVEVRLWETPSSYATYRRDQC